MENPQNSNLYHIYFKILWFMWRIK